MKTVKIICSSLLMTILVGCASSPRILNMVPPTDHYQFSNTNKTIKVEMVYGGQESDPIFEGSRIDNTSFMGALLQGLTNSNLFKKVNPSENPDYYLTAMILSQDQPLMGFNMTVTLLVRYTITSGIDKTQTWQKDIVSQYTATVGDAFVGATRLNKANEGSVRENIRLLLEEISKLEL